MPAWRVPSWSMAPPARMASKSFLRSSLPAGAWSGGNSTTRKMLPPRAMRAEAGGRSGSSRRFVGEVLEGGGSAVDHSIYDKRRYPIVGVREGYAEWAPRYEQTVYDEMDLRLLERLRTVDWSSPRSVLDLACGTGRIGAWLRRRCPAAAVDGVDITPEMLDVARSRGIYRTLAIADVASTGLAA